MLDLLFPFYSFFFNPWFLEHTERVREGEIIPLFGLVCGAVVVFAIVARWFSPGAADTTDDDIITASLLSWFLELFAVTVVAGLALMAWTGEVNALIALPTVFLIPLVLRLRKESPILRVSSWLVSSCMFAFLFGTMPIVDEVWQMTVVNVVIAAIFYVIALVSSFGLPIVLEWKNAPWRALFLYGLSFLSLVLR